MTAILVEQCRRMGRMPKTDDPAEMEKRMARARLRRKRIEALSSWDYGTMYLEAARANRYAATKTTAPIRETWKQNARELLAEARKVRIGRLYVSLARKHRAAMQRRKATA